MTRDQFPQTGRDTPYPPDDPDTERPDGPLPVPDGGPDRPPPPDPPPPPVSDQTGQPEQGSTEPNLDDAFAGFEFGAGADLDETKHDTVAVPGVTGDAEPEHAIVDVTDAEPEHAIASTSDDFTHAIFEHVTNGLDAVEDGHSLSDFDMDG